MTQTLPHVHPATTPAAASSRCSKAALGGHADVRVIRRSDLAYEPEGRYRGWAHIGFDDFPEQAPGRLDFGHLTLFAEGHMHPGEGFDMHAHHDVDDLVVVLSGTVRHRDSLRNDELLGAGDVALLAAGRSIAHASHVHGDERVRAFVVMLRPDMVGGPSGWHRTRIETSSAVQVLAAGGFYATEHAMPLRSDACVSVASLDGSVDVRRELEPSDRLYVCVTDGSMQVGGRLVQEGERALVEGPGTVHVLARESARALLVEMRGQ